MAAPTSMINPVTLIGTTLAGMPTPVLVDANGNMGQAAAPFASAAVTISSGNVANASAVAAMPAVAAKTNYCSGIICTASGSTAGLPVNVTVAGLLGGTMTLTFTFPAGVLVGANPLICQFDPPLPASAVNTAITLTLPAGGAGNTNAASSIQGYVV